jgi:type IV pilus assembly protein PilW
MRKTGAGSRQHGFSLVELMVAVTIGLMLTLAVASLFVVNKRTFRTQDDASRLEESSRAAFDILGYHIRLAGFVDASDDPNMIGTLLNASWNQNRKTNPDLVAQFFGAAAPYVGLTAIRGCDGTFDSTTAVAPACTAGAVDSIMVAYQARPSTVGAATTVRTTLNAYQDTLGAYNAATGQGGDCGGLDVAGATANPSGPLAINRFYLDAATQRLMCIGNGDPTKPRPIAEGVEAMQILYGIVPTAASTTQPDAFAGRYVTAANVTNWAQVLAVRVCLQIAQPTQNIATDVPGYTQCDGTVVTSASQTDGKIRRVFRATFALRNIVLTAPDALP